ncbi:MAG: CHAT domain-containing protein [Candidatus Obscuribacterales bacterium]|nr:CHAT domain-containing protein [Candidatus Obscuribacterales bacterium]
MIGPFVSTFASTTDSPVKQADKLYDAAKATYESGNLPQAIALMQQAVEMEKSLKRHSPLVRSLSALATILVANNQTYDARKTYEEALATAKQFQLIDDALSITISLGSLSMQQGNLVEAKKYYELAYADAKANNMAAITANALMNLSVVERSQNHLKEAMSYLDKALPIVEQSGSDAEMGRLYMEIGRVQADLGSVNDALDNYRHAKEKFNQDFDTASEGKALMASGQLLAGKARYDEALAQLQEAQKVLTQDDVQSKLLLIDCQTSLAAISTAQGKFEESNKILSDALSSAKALKNSDRTRAVLSELGYVQFVSGNVEQALDKYLAAYALLGKDSGKSGTIKAVLTTDLAMCYKSLGQLDLAIKNYEQAYAMLAASADTRAKALAANNLAVAYLDNGKIAEFNKIFAEASALLASLNDKKGQAILAYNLGQSKLFSGKSAEAIADYQSALSLIRGAGDKNLEGQALRGEGLAYLLSSQPDKAIDSYNKAIALADAGNTEARWDCHLGLGKAYRALGQTDAALASLRQAAEMAEQERSQLSRDTFKTFNLDLRQDCFYELVDLLVQQGHAEEALEIAERSRARAFTDLLAARQGVAHSLSANGGEDSLNSKVLPSDLTHLSQEYSTANNVTSKALSLAELKQQVVDHNAVCLEFYSLPDKLLVWLIDANGSIRLLPAQPISQKQLRKNVVELYNLLIAQPKSLEEIKKQGQLRQAKLKQMHKLLLGSAEPLLAGKQLIIIPHGPLFLVPFAALMNQQGKFVVENSVLSVVPAVSVLQSTAKLRDSSLNDNTLMAFGNPKTEIFATLGSLPYAEKEVVKAAELFGAAKSTKRLGVDATRATFVSTAPKSSVVHMACHGIINEEQPTLSGLVLAKDGNDNGFMTVKDILSLPPLKSKLIVLSACQTGRGKITGDGVIGLSRAFIAAGTPSVIVSHWNVDDVIAEFQMEVFYKTLLAGKGKAEALREAQLQTISTMEGSMADPSSPTFIRANPRYWAAFQLIGEAK